MRRVLLVTVTALWASPTAQVADLEQQLGRNEIRVRSAPYPLVAGRTVEKTALLERLERLGYRRVHERPTTVGEYFYGHEVFWIYRRPHRWNGRDHAASLIGLALRREDGNRFWRIDKSVPVVR